MGREWRGVKNSVSTESSITGFIGGGEVGGKLEIRMRGQSLVMKEQQCCK